MLRRMLLMLMIRIGKFNMRPRKGENTKDYTHRVRKDIKLGQRIAKFITPAPGGIERKETKLGGRPCWHFTPQKPNGKTILMIHGGAYFLGLEHMYHTYSAYAMELAKATECEVYAIDYRLTPEHQMIDMLDDCLTAYKELLEKGVKPKDLIVSGDSAGGQLTLALLLRLRDEKVKLPAGAIPVSAGTDLTASGESFMQRAKIDPMLPYELKNLDRSELLGAYDVKHPYMSSLYGDYKELPPLLMFVGGREILYDDTIRVAEKAKKAGVDVTLDIDENMFHVYPLFARVLPEGRKALKTISSFIQRVSP